jgi:cell division septation protein DedD
MISIAEAISDLLFVRDTVVVPGLGAFIKKPISAKVNPVANYFAMPSSEITFDAHLREDNDLVINYISEKNEVPEDEAKRLLTMFVSDCFNNLKTGKKVVLKDIGTLSFDWADDLVFEPSNTLNYNADAFGLSDFTPVPVIISKSKDEIKAEIEQQQRDKNTPVTVDEKAVHEEDEEPERHYGWLWILLGLLLLAGIGFGLHYFKVVDFSRWFERKEKPTEFEPWTVTFPSEVKTWSTENTEQVAPQESDTLEELPTEVVQEPESVELDQESEQEIAQESEPEVVHESEPVKPEANIRIIAGCFAQEENANRLANALRDKGYQNAFVEKRGSKWFVAFGRYATDEEATQALRDIRANGDDKAWILK